VKFSYNLLKKYVNTKIAPKELAEVLSTKTAEVEQIDKSGSDLIMEVKILYNRGDLFSHFGLAREIAALTNGKIKNLDFNYKETNEKVSDLIEVVVENNELCPRYTAKVIKNVKIKESPKWLKDTLTNLGLKPINNVVDATNYVMIEIGQPLHAFDLDRISVESVTYNSQFPTSRQKKKQIIVRNAKKGEKIKVLDGANTEYELDEDMLIIADPKKTLAIAGIKGGVGSEINKTTRNIILESANFNQSNIRQTSIKLGLKTDASTRFSYGIDPNLAETAINRVSQLIQELAGGKVVKGMVDIYPRRLKPWKITVKKDHINSLIGVEIPEKQIKKILTNLGMVVSTSKDLFIVNVPTYRLDIQTPEDVIEEIARVYGYENIKPIPPVMDVYRPAESKTSEDWDIEQLIKARSLMKNILRGLGFTECYNYSFVSEKTKEIFNMINAPEILNPISKEAKYLRSGLLPNLIIAAQKNLRFYKSVKLFETGNIFIQKGDEITEKEIIAGVVVGEMAFAEIKGVLESFLGQLGISEVEFSDDLSSTHSTKLWYHPGRAAEVRIGKRTIGLIGNLHPQIKSELDFKPNLEIAQFSLAIAPLVRAMEEELEFEPIPKYPSIIRDISILVDKDVKISQILNLIQGVGGRLVKDIDVFDIYETAETQDESEGTEEADETQRWLSSGRKSVAFHIIYRADDRTLTDAEVDKLEQKIKKALEQGLGAEIR
jgi:phenylalanyl-tRNA synthetase beta chain